MHTLPPPLTWPALLLKVTEPGLPAPRVDDPDDVAQRGAAEKDAVEAAAAADSNVGKIKELCEAAKSDGNRDKIEELKDFVNERGPEPGSVTAIFVAAEHNQCEAIEKLLDLGADVHPEPRTAACCTCSQQRVNQGYCWVVGSRAGIFVGASQ